MSGGVFPGDWSQLLSGLVSAAVTGLLVAGVVSSADRRRQRREAAGDWERVRRTIHLPSELASDGPTGTGSVDVPAWAYGLVQSLKTHPLPRWARLIRDEPLQKCLQIEALTEDVKECAGHLEVRLFALAETASRTAQHPQTHQSLTNHVRALVRGESSEPWIPLGIAQDQYDAAVAQVMSDPDFTALRGEWLQLTARIAQLGSDLREGLTHPIDERAPRGLTSRTLSRTAKEPAGPSNRTEPE